MKTIIAIIFSVTMVFASGLYDDQYSVNSSSEQIESKMDKYLMYGDFDQILRFEPLFFHPSTNLIKQESSDYLEEVTKAYEKYKDRDITLTIIGYTDHVQTKTEKVNQSTWFPTYTNDLTIESSQEIALGYATYTHDELVNKGVPENLIIVEQRGGLDNLYTRATQEGRENNYRAMVTMYVGKANNADSDNDGVIDAKDKCPYTPAGHTVNSDGCSELLNLTIHYNVNSSVIRDISFEKLTKMIAFMKKYPNFKAVLYGHTSSEGTRLNNQILSEKRALSIRKYLITQGINSSRISVYGRASTQPIASNDTVEGREENRRVEIKLH
jgi:outer membrane protein OmpA-like peptidoglycan-associated protein